MISMEQAKKMWTNLSSNSKKLASCDKPHDFSIQSENNWKCSKCGGEVEEKIKLWYEKGILHANKISTHQER